MRIVFMGTPDFSVGTLKALAAAGHEIVLAVTQPDKPKGRGKSVLYTPVKEAALELGIPVFQPKRVREPECVEYLKEQNADLFVVVAFGQILPQEVLDLPPYGCINVHASLLPKYRGAAPIQWAVIDRLPVTGVTTMQMDAGMDTGDILMTREVPLEAKETGGSLFDKLSLLGAQLCVETVRGLADGTVVPKKQDHDAATYTRRIEKKDGALDFSKPAAELEALIRGLNPWPSAFTKWNGKTLKIWDADVLDEAQAGVKPEDGTVPGTVCKAAGGDLYVMTGCGILAIRELQEEGKKRMDTAAFLRGHSIPEKMVFGEG